MMFFFIYFAFVGYVVSIPTIKSLENLEIVGGEDIDITEAPYQVALERGGSFACGGTIIAKDIIVTAAHCIFNLSPTEHQIRAGSSNREQGGELYPIGDLKWHPDYSNKGLDCDIGVLWLSKPLKFSDRVAPLSLMPHHTIPIPNGDVVVVTGWGLTGEDADYADILQRIIIPKISEKQCQEAYAGHNITSNMLCAAVNEGGRGPCLGDSGGPLFYDNKLAGVVSWGEGCAKPGKPSVYAKVSALRPWLDEVIDQLRRKHVLRTAEKPSKDLISIN